MTAVRIDGANEITVTLAMAGEGEQWVAQNHLRLSPDGEMLTVVGSRGHSGQTLYRVR